MKFIEKQMNLFDVDEKYYFVQCISSDAKMGLGIAVEFDKRFNLKDRSLEIINRWMSQNNTCPNCIFVDKVFNLITKKNYWDKPTYDSVRASLECLRMYCLSMHVYYLAMPRIASGLDRLQWGKVREMIQEIFL
jgi:alkylhydroperoxidase family enzyme